MRPVCPPGSLSTQQPVSSPERPAGGRTHTLGRSAPHAAPSESDRKDEKVDRRQFVQSLGIDLAGPIGAALEALGGEERPVRGNKDIGDLDILAAGAGEADHLQGVGDRLNRPPTPKNMRGARALYYRAISEAQVDAPLEAVQRARAAHVTVQRTVITVTQAAIRVCGG